jgi:hypothetical protein
MTIRETLVRCLQLISLIFINLVQKMDSRKAMELQKLVERCHTVVMAYETDIPLRLLVYNNLGFSKREDENLPSLSREIDVITKTKLDIMSSNFKYSKKSSDGQELLDFITNFVGDYNKKMKLLLAIDQSSLDNGYINNAESPSKRNSLKNISIIKHKEEELKSYTEKMIIMTHQLDILVGMPDFGGQWKEKNTKLLQTYVDFCTVSMDANLNFDGNSIAATKRYVNNENVDNLKKVMYRLIKNIEA